MEYQDWPTYHGSIDAVTKPMNVQVLTPAMQLKICCFYRVIRGKTGPSLQEYRTRRAHLNVDLLMHYFPTVGPNEPSLATALRATKRSILPSRKSRKQGM